MLNQKISQIFQEIADILEMEDVPFKPRAYRKAAISIKSLSQDVKEIYQEDGLAGLEEIPGVGKSMALKIEEIIKTGKMKYYQELKKKMPVNVLELVAIEGLGPKIIKKLYQKLKVRTLNDLEKVLKAHKVQKIKGLGPKVEENLLEGLRLVRKRTKRHLLGFIYLEAQEIKKALEENKDIERVEFAGSIRRGEETIGDIDILAISEKPRQVIDFFIKLPQVKAIVAQGSTKAAVRLKGDIDCDLRVLKAESYGSALLYFTGSKAFNIHLRKIAQGLGWKLNEYGLFSKKRRIAGKTEEEIFQKLKLSYIEPELRQDRGEIEAAAENKLPDLVKLRDIQGIFHLHSRWSGDATGKIEDLAIRVKKMGLKYMAMADHVGVLRIAGGMQERDILKYLKEIKEINRRLSGFRIFSGIEANILKDGKIDISDKILEKLDVVTAAIHSHFRMSKPEMTKRMIKAIENKNVDIISHPTGRIIQEREAYQIDMEAIMRAARKNKVVLEINAYPNRLDLAPENIRKAVSLGVKMAIGLDSHSLAQLHYLDLGVICSRRGWAEKKDIINTYPAKRIERMFRNK